MKDTGKSSSRKLRRVIYYLLYRMDPQKTLYKISFSTKTSKIQNSGFFFALYGVVPDKASITLHLGGCYLTRLDRPRRLVVGETFRVMNFV